MAGTRHWAHPSHICAGTGLCPPTSAPGLGPPLPQPPRRALTRTSRVARNCGSSTSRIGSDQKAESSGSAASRQSNDLCEIHRKSGGEPNPRGSSGSVRSAAEQLHDRNAAGGVWRRRTARGDGPRPTTLRRGRRVRGRRRRASAPGLGSPHPHLHRDLGSPNPHLRRNLGSPRPHLRRDRARAVPAAQEDVELHRPRVVEQECPLRHQRGPRVGDVATMDPCCNQAPRRTTAPCAATQGLATCCDTAHRALMRDQ